MRVSVLLGLIAGYIFTALITATNDDPLEQPTTAQYLWTAALTMTPLRYTSDLWEYLYYGQSPSTSCPYRDNMATSVRNNLKKYIQGQSEGIDTIVNALSAWEFQHHDTPLVLALTGPTGVGKSETAYRLAEAVLAKHVRAGSSKKSFPAGLLTLYGQDFSDGSLHEVQTRIKARIAEHVFSCGGNAVVVLDEVQKVLPGALEVLVPALDSRGSLSTYSRSTSSDQRPASATPEKSLDHPQAWSPTRRHEDRPERVVQVSTERVIFILISDIGADKMIKLVLEYGNRTLIPRQLIRHEVRASLDEQWSRLRLGKLVKEVVPYLPLEPEHIRLIMRGKLMHTASEYRYNYWLDLIVDPDVVFFLASPPFVKYSVFQAKMSSRGGAIANVPAAAATDSQCLNSPNCDLSTSSSSNNGGSSTHPTAKTKIFATWGARSLVNAGPLQDLNVLIDRFCKPWRPGDILHVGMTRNSSSNRLLRNRKWGTSHTEDDAASNQMIYLQWCAVGAVESVAATRAQAADSNDSCNGGNDSCPHPHPYVFQIDEAMAFSDFCETLWYGLFPTSL